MDIAIIRNETFILDEQELKFALKENIISIQDYLLAKNKKEKITIFLDNKININLFKDCLIDKFNKMVRNIE